MSSEEKKDWTPEQEAKFNRLFEHDGKEFMGVDFVGNFIKSHKESAQTISKKCLFYAKVIEKVNKREGAYTLIEQMENIAHGEVLTMSEKQSIYQDIAGLPKLLRDASAFIDKKLK